MPHRSIPSSRLVCEKWADPLPAETWQKVDRCTSSEAAEIESGVRSEMEIRQW